MKLLIDTDIGDDIDDSLAIAWAIRLNLEIVGITTVYRDAPERAKIVKRLLSLSGREEIPVKYGESVPLTKSGFLIGHFNYTAEYDGELEGGGAEFIAECAEKYGEELTVLALGEQTNLAKAYLEYPEKMKKVGRVVMMGGAFFAHCDEWNIAGDPTAARIVMEKGERLEYVNWDMTRYAGIGEANTRRILSANENEQSLRGYVVNLVKQWTKRNRYFPILHDPLALYYCLDDSAFETMRVTAKVLDEGDFSGLILNTSDFQGHQNRRTLHGAGNSVRVCKKADYQFLVEKFMKDVFGE